MRISRSGFTIVELLIVIVVIAILATISTVAYNGVQQRARNTVRAVEMQSWDKILKLYRATYGTFPQIINGSYCLGEGFPIGYNGEARCRNYTDANQSISYKQSDNTSLMNELKKMGSLPKNDRTPAGYVVGPYIDYYGTDYYIVGTFSGSSASDCPKGTQFSYTDSASLVLCYINS